MDDITKKKLEAGAQMAFGAARCVSGAVTGLGLGLLGGFLRNHNHIMTAQVIGRRSIEAGAKMFKRGPRRLEGREMSAASQPFGKGDNAVVACPKCACTDCRGAESDGAFQPRGAERIRCAPCGTHGRWPGRPRHVAWSASQQCGSQKRVPLHRLSARVLTMSWRARLPRCRAAEQLNDDNMTQFGRAAFRCVAGSCALNSEKRDAYGSSRARDRARR